jgi:hypothetical protein
LFYNFILLAMFIAILLKITCSLNKKTLRLLKIPCMFFFSGVSDYTKSDIQSAFITTLQSVIKFLPNFVYKEAQTSDIICIIMSGVWSQA